MTNLAYESIAYDSILERPSGRHAFSEDAVLTPIFHALTRGRLRRRSEPGAPARSAAALDPVERFRRNPLTAPIPAQALAGVASSPWLRAVPAVVEPGVDPERGSGRRRLRGGRHHRRLEVVG